MASLFSVVSGLCLMRNRLWYFNEDLQIDGRTKLFQVRFLKFLFKVHEFWKGHKICEIFFLLLTTISQKWGEDFAKFCGLLKKCIWTLTFLNSKYNEVMTLNNKSWIYLRITNCFHDFERVIFENRNRQCFSWQKFAETSVKGNH